MEELLDADLGSGASGGVATAVRPVVLPAAFRTRAKIAGAVVLGAGLLVAAWLAPLFPGPAPTHTAFEQCVQQDDVSAIDYGKPRRTLLQLVGVAADVSAVDAYDINQFTVPLGLVVFARDTGQANAIVYSLKAEDSADGLPDYFDNKIVGNNVVVRVMTHLRTGPDVDDIVTACAAR